MFGFGKKEDVTKKIKETLEGELKYFEFAQKQMTADRAYFDWIYKLTAGMIALVFVAGAYVTWASMDALRKDIKASADAELLIVKNEVKSKISEQFDQKNIATLIQEVARERADRDLSAAIKAEASSQINQVIKEERERINQLIEHQVSRLLKEVDGVLAFSNLVVYARAYHRPSYDQLVILANTKEDINPRLRQMAQFTTSSIENTLEEATKIRSPLFSGPADEIKKLLFSEKEYEREGALDSYDESDKSFVPLLVKLIQSDKSVIVAWKAVHKFNEATGNSFKYADAQRLIEWWEKNKGSYETKTP